MLHSKLCFAALYAKKKMLYSTPKLDAFKGWINCSLCMQFGTGLQGPLCVLGSVLFKIVVYHWYLPLILKSQKQHMINKPLQRVG